MKLVYSDKTIVFMETCSDWKLIFDKLKLYIKHSQASYIYVLNYAHIKPRTYMF